MSECFAVVSGDYSDYTVHCVFEREEDATEYARLVNVRETREYHERWRNNIQPIMSPFSQQEVPKHQSDFEDCKECRRRMTERYYSMVVERFPFHVAGEVPHADAVKA